MPSLASCQCLLFYMVQLASLPFSYLFLPSRLSFVFLSLNANFFFGGGGGGAGAQSVEGETPGEEVVGSIPPVAARSLLVGSVSV